jgi:hypothetical protein
MSPEPDNMMMDHPEPDPLHQFPNEFVFLENQQQNNQEQHELDLAPEHYAPFYTKKKLDITHFHINAGVSMTKMTEYFQIQKDNDDYQSVNMKQIAQKIRNIPIHHPHLAAGDWIIDTFGNNISRFI